MKTKHSDFFKWLRVQPINIKTKLEMVKDRLELHEDSIVGDLVTVEELNKYNFDLNLIRREAGYYEDLLEKEVDLEQRR